MCLSCKGAGGMNMCFSIFLPARGQYFGIWLPMGGTHCVNSCLASRFDFGFVVCILKCCTWMTDIQASRIRKVVLSCCPLPLALFCSLSQGDEPPLTQMLGMRLSSLESLALQPSLCPVGPHTPSSHPNCTCLVLPTKPTEQNPRQPVYSMKET